MEKAEENPGSRGDRPPNPRGEARESGKKRENFKKKSKKAKKSKKKTEILLDTFPVRVYILSHRRR